MNKITITATALLLAFAIHTGTASAHQPHYVGTDASITIPDASTSRAYYGELVGQPAVYTVTSEKEFSLYLNILSPYIPNADKDFAVRVTNAAGSTITTLHALAADWQPWYEDFGGDTYWKGPEFKETVPAGTYTIAVSNPTNTGKYVLAPGEAEVFTVGGTPSTIKQLYLVKTEFFDKPWYSMFEGVIGKVLLGISVILLVIIGVGATLLYKHIIRRRA